MHLIKKGILYLILIHLTTQVCGQNLSYKLSGIMPDSISGTVYLAPAIADNKYYESPANLMDSATISKGRFQINRRVYNKETLPYILIFQGKISGVTNMILLSAKDEVIKINKVDEYDSPDIPGSKAQKEMIEYLRYFSKPIITQIKRLDSLSAVIENAANPEVVNKERQQLMDESELLQAKSDSLFLYYVKTHYSSEVAFWKLLERYKYNGFKNQYHEAFNFLSNNIRQSRVGKLLEKELSVSATTAIGNTIPDIEVKNTEFEKINLIPAGSDNVYILIDFWFSNCMPCIRQFPEMKQIYQQYMVSGFQIIGVSVDGEPHREDWLQQIKKSALEWPNYLDEDGVLSTKWGINSFPSNILLDMNGVVLAKNISTKNLKEFLRHNLNTYDNQMLNLEPK